MDNLLQQSFRTSMNRRAREIHIPEARLDETKKDTAEPVRIQCPQQMLHLRHIQFRILQHHHNVTHLLQSAPVCQEMPSEMQNQTYEI